jgi:fructose-specific component phosphotransferase system IIB-like protein
VLKLSNNEFDFIIIVALDVWNDNDFIGKKLYFK